MLCLDRFGLRGSLKLLLAVVPFVAGAPAVACRSLALLLAVVSFAITLGLASLTSTFPEGVHLFKLRSVHGGTRNCSLTCQSLLSDPTL